MISLDLGRRKPLEIEELTRAAQGTPGLLIFTGNDPEWMVDVGELRRRWRDEEHSARVRVNGVELSYKIEGKGEPWLLLHGMRDSKEVWRPLIPSFLRKGRQVITVDLRGHGLSDKPQGEYSYQVLAADIQALVDALGIEKINVLGHSLGAAIAIKYAATNPERVGKLTLLAVNPAEENASGFRPPDTEELAARKTFGQIVRYVLTRLFPLGRTFCPDEHIKRIREEVFWGWMLTEYAMNVALIRLQRENLLPLLKTLQLPTQIVQGERDTMCSPEIGQMIQDTMPHARLDVVRDAAHFMFLERLEDTAYLLSKTSP